MRVFLAYPHDMSLPGMTFGSLAVLNACMKEAGHETMVADLNAEAFTYMAQPTATLHICCCCRCSRLYILLWQQRN